MFIFTTESWVLTLSKKEQENFDDIVREGVANHPKRREALMFSFFGRDFEYLAQCLISRPDNKVEKGPILWDAPHKGRLSTASDEEFESRQRPH